MLEEILCKVVLERYVLALGNSVVEYDSCNEDRSDDRCDDTDDKCGSEALDRT